MQENHQKIKLLKLLELLRQETDEQNPLSTKQICRRLEDMDISCERRTLSKDVQLLNDQGYEVMSSMVGHEKAYYVEDRAFSVPELKVLIDAVQASSFITETKSDQLIEKIADLGGSHRAEILKSNRVFFNTHKHGNESIYYNVDRLEEALMLKQKASFLYFDLNDKRERVYRKEKARYTVEPIALVYSEDNYYLTCYTPKHRSLTNYRVDRMESVAVEEDAISKEALKQVENAENKDYTDQLFKMFNGNTENVTLSFDKALIGSVYDRFGEKIDIKRIDDTTCKVRVKVRISPTFYGWVFTFCGRMKILSPLSVIDEYRMIAKEIADQI